MINISNDVTQKNNPRSIKNIVVHCTAGWQNETIDQLLKGFKARGWKMPGYHYVVKANGDVVSLLPETLVANGVQGHNANSIHISYMGGINAHLKPFDNRTPAQKNALQVSLRILKGKYPNAVICGHRDFSHDIDGDGILEPNEWIKVCPCFDAKKEYSLIK